MSVSSNEWQKKGEDGMGKAGKRKEMVEDRSSEVLCEKVVCEKVYPMYLKKSRSEFCGDGGRQIV